MPDTDDILLTTFPGHKSRNVGDNFITYSVINMIKLNYPQYDPTILFRETPLDNHTNVSNIVAPGFSISNNTYPELFKLYSDINNLPNFYPIGASFQHILPSREVFENYEYNQETLDFLNLVAQKCGEIPCRDQLIVDLLKRFNIPACYSGDMVLFDPDVIGTPFKPPQTIKSIAFTIQHHPKYYDQSIALLNRIKQEYPNTRLFVCLHSKPNKMSLDVAAEAKKIGFEEKHLYGDIENLKFYDEIDLHIGYRLHGHITFLRKRKPSILMVEDARAFGFSRTEGTSIGCIDALSLTTLEADMKQIEVAIEYTKQQIKTHFSDYNTVFAFIDKTYNEYLKGYFSKIGHHLKTNKTIDKNIDRNIWS
ncbi:MAG: hypothetical protein ACJAXL_001436, partial [Alphaproteobacteria bacterium]